MAAKSPAPVVHFEIGCKNAKSLKGFYADIFGWQYYPSEGPSTGPTDMAMTSNLGAYAESPSAGIGGHLNQLGHPPHNYVTVYIQVDDIPATIKLIEQKGGKQLVPMTEVPGMGHFAWFTDPEGNALGLWKAAQG